MIQEVLDPDFSQRLAVIDSDIDLSIIYNPFDKTDRTDTKLIWASNKTLADYLDGLPTEVEWVVAVNNRLITAEQFATTKLNPSDKLSIAVVPQGSAGKTIFRIIAIIAVVVASVYFGPEIAGAYFGGSAAAAAGVTATLTAVGSLLVNSLLPAPSPTPASTSGASSPTYGYDGPANTATEDTPIPVVYGTYVTGGNVINSSTQTDGDDQYLYMEVALSEGPVSNIYDIQLNGQDASYWNDITVETRLGANTQSRIPWFNNILISESIGQILDVESNAITHTTLEAVEQFRVDFVFPNGLESFDSHGGKFQMSVDIQMSYRLHGTTAWINLPDTLVVKTQQTAVRVSALGPVLDLGIYDIKMWRTVAERNDGLTLETCQVIQVVGILLDPVNYVNTAVVGLKIKADKQLSSFPTLTAKVDGKTIHTYDAYGVDQGLSFNSNPAWVALDMLTNSRYGGNLALSRFDMPRWYDWSEACAYLGLHWNGVFDTTTNIWDAVQQVMRIGRAQIIRSGQLYTVAMEIADDPVMLFGPGNMIEKSFNLAWLGMSDRANEIEVQYNDATDNYRQHTVRVVDNDAYNRGDAPRQSSIQLLGCTDFDQAQREAYLQLALNKYITQTATWDSPLEAIACTIGDVVFVAHDMPNWSTAGRIAPGSTASSIILDKPVTIDASNPYQLLILHSAVHVLDVSVISVNGNSITINAQPNVVFHRVIKGSKDVMVLRRTTVGSQEIVDLDGPAGIANGDTVALWAVDFIETIPVTGMASGTYTTLTLDHSLVQNPADFANYMFGPLATVQRPFRIQKISGSGDHHRTLTATEYNANIYLDPENPGQPPIYTSPQFTIAPIQVDHWSEELIGHSDKRSRVTFEWAANPGLKFVYDGADIYLARGNADERLIATIRNAETNYSVDADVGDVLTVRLVPIDNRGKRGNSLASTPVSYTVVGNNIAPPAPSNLTANAAALSITLNWVNPEIPNLHHVEIYENTADDLSTASHIADSLSSQFIRGNLPKNSTRYYWVRAVDTSGNVSAFSNAETDGVPATTLGNLTTDLVGQIVNAQIAKNAIDASNLISGQQLVQSVSSISVADHTVSNFAYDTSTGQMYTWNGTAWVIPTAVAKTGSITTASFAAGIAPVQIVSSLSSVASPTEGMVVMLTSDGKLYRYHSGAWTSAISGGDIPAGAMDITKFASGLAPVQIDSHAPPTISGTEGQTCVSTVDGKLYRYHSGAWTKAIDGTADILANTITAGAIQTGAITAQQIAAGSLTASRLAIGDTTNLIIDQTFLDNPQVNATGPYWAISDSIGTVAGFNSGAFAQGKTGVPTSATFNTSLIPASNVNSFFIYTPPIAIHAGKNYRLRLDAYSSSSNKNLALRIQYFDTTGTALSQDNTVALTPASYSGTVASEFEHIYTPPTGAASMSVRFMVTGNIPDSTAGTGAWYIGSPRLERQASGTLISNGAITTAHISAGGIDGSAITANTITAGQIAAGAINTQQLAAGAVTASILAVDTSNMLSDPSFMDIAASGWNGATSYWRQQLTSSGANSTIWTLLGSTDAINVTMGIQNSASVLASDAATGSNGTLISSSYIQINQIQAYRVQALFHASGGGVGASAQTIRLEARFYDGTKTLLGTVNGASFTAAQCNPYIAANLSVGGTGESAIPTGSVYVQWCAHVLHNGDTGVTNFVRWRVGLPSVRLGVTGTLIAPGTITTANIGAGQITANTIQSGTITAAQINASAGITGPMLAAGTITGDKIFGATITGTNIVAGTLTGDKLNANFFQGQKFTAAAGTNGLLQMDGTNTAPGGGIGGGPAFRVYDNQTTPQCRALLGRNGSLYGLWVFDAAGNPIFVEDGLADSTVATGTIAAGAVTKPYGFSITSNISVVQGPTWSPIWTQSFVVGYPANGVFQGTMFIDFNNQNGMNFRYRVRIGSATGTDSFSPVDLGPGIFNVQPFVGTFGIGAGTFYFVLEAQTVTADGNNAHILPGSTGMMLVCQR